MEKALFDKYVEERYLGQMAFYSKSSGKNQGKYRKFQWALIILSALTPVFAALGSFKHDLIPQIDFKNTLNLLVIIVSVIVAILTTGLKTFNYQELWVTYRSTYEQLKPEIHYYNFNVGPYGDAGIDKESLFVTRIEKILSTEHTNWPPAKNQAGQSGKTKPGEGEQQQEAVGNQEANAPENVAAPAEAENQAAPPAEGQQQAQPGVDEQDTNTEEKPEGKE